MAATIKVESAPGDIKTTIDGVNAQGQPAHTVAAAAMNCQHYYVK